MHADRKTWHFRFRGIPLGLRARLLGLAGLVVLPALAYSLWLCAEARHQAMRNERLRALAALETIVDRQSNLVTQAETLLQSLASNPLVLAPDRTACSHYLADLLKVFPHYVTIGVIDADGWLGCSAILPPTPLRLSDRPWFRAVLDSGRFAVGQYQISRLTGKATVNFAYPIKGAKGQVRRVVAAAVDLQWISDNLQSLPLPRQGSFFLFDAKGTVLARVPESAPSFDPARLAALTGHAGGVLELPNGAGQAIVLTYAPLPVAASGLYAAIGFPPQAAEAVVEAMVVRHLIGATVVLVLVVTLTWLGGTWLILRPVKALQRATTALAEGDLSARVGLPPGSGELCALGASFDAMAERIEHDTVLLREAETSLRGNCEMLDSLFAAFPNPVFYKDIEGRYQGCNEHFSRDILGLPREAVIGHTLEELKDHIPPSLAQIYHEKDQILFSAGGVQRYEAPVRCSDGSVREFYLSKASYHNAANTEIGLVGVMLDISQLKDYERDLKRRLAHSAALAELSEAVIARMDSIEAFSRLVLAKARELTESPHGFVGSLDPHTGDMVSHTLTDMLPPQCLMEGDCRRTVFPMNARGHYDGLWGQVLNTLHPFYTNAPQSHDASRGTPKGHIRIERFLAAPAVFEGKLLGQIALANATRPYTDDDCGIVVDLARILAVALYRGRLEEGLRASLREKEIMLREIHHRVKNNLHTISGLLDLQAGQVEAPAAREAFEETRNRIASMAQVHAEMYASDDFSAINLTEHARGLALRLLGRLGRGRDIGVSVSGEAVWLTVEQAIPASLLLNELVTNCFRHAFSGFRSGTILIRLERKDEHVVVTVRDDGIGLPPQFDLTAPHGLGVVLASGLAEQLGGTLAATSDGGTVFSVRFPVELAVGNGNGARPVQPV